MADSPNNKTGSKLDALFTYPAIRTLRDGIVTASTPAARDALIRIIKDRAKQLDPTVTDADLADLEAFFASVPVQGLPPEIERSLKEKRVRDLWEGRGPTEKNELGQPFARTRRGYDASLLRALVRRGLRDVEVLRAAVNHRPATPYDAEQRTPQEADATITLVLAMEPLETAERGGEAGPANPAWTEFQMVAQRSDPPVFKLRTPTGQWMVLTAEQLQTPRLFQQRCIECLFALPEMPKKKDWAVIVNGWFKNAKYEAAPPEASEDARVTMLIDRLVHAAPRHESFDDVRAGKVVLKGKSLVFTTDAVIDMLRRQAGLVVKTHQLCRLLRDHGYVNTTVRFEDRVVKAWVADTARDEPPTPAPEAGEATA